MSALDERLDHICKKSLELRNLQNDKRYLKRLKWELEEIAARNKAGYFLNLYDSRTRYPQNQNNLLVCYLLGIVKDHSIDQDPKCEYGEYPDIDIDYLPEVRDYLKSIWAPATFGAEYVCNIGNYTTFGIKSALLDMARVHDKDKDVVQTITKNLDIKDDEGKPLTWDAALRMSPELKKYCEENPDVADAACRLLNRNRGMGVHAGGLIIANQPLSDLVPLVKRKDNPQASAWGEGLSGQDLSPVGLVKFDLLVISNLLQIARCCEMVKKRHGLTGICNRPGEPDWSDVPKWRNDPKALAMANSGDLKCIFQFDSEGIRALVKAGGVDRFEDMVAYAALYRPGPLGERMQERYTERKRGREKYSLHALLKPILDTTYGVMVYQEQIMKILHVVGEIPLKDCELVRKAISKKKIEGFIKYKELFIHNGMKNLNVNEDEINNLWKQVEAFSEYGFNKSMHHDTIIDCVDGSKQIKHIQAGDKVYCINERGERAETEVVAVHDHGVIDVVEVIFDDGYSVKCTLDHKFLTEEGQIPLWKIIQDNLVVLSSPLEDQNAKVKKLEQNKSYEKNAFGFIPDYAPISDTRSLLHKKVLRIVPVGKRQCYDLEVAVSTHNFILPNGIITSNSHSCAYTYISAWLLYLKAHFPHEFYAAVLSCENLTDKIKEYKMESKIHGVEMHRLDINKSKINFDLQNDVIFYGLSKVKGIGEVPAKRIADNQPYSSFEDFLARFGTDASVLKPLIGLRCFSDADAITLWKFAEYYKDCFKKIEDKKKRYEASMIRYEEEFKELTSDSRTLAEICDQTEVNPFDSVVWKNKFDQDEEIEVNKEVLCDKDDPGAVARVEIEDYELGEDIDIVLQREVIKYYRIGKGKKTSNKWKELRKLWQRRAKSIERFKEIEKSTLPKLSNFDPNSFVMNNDLLKLLRDPIACEEEYYGFAWIHELERSPDYIGNMTFESLKNNLYVESGPVELQVKDVKKITSKKNVVYFQVTAEDVTGAQAKINIFMDDWLLWHQEFGWNKPVWDEEEKTNKLKDDGKICYGNLLRVRLKPPTGSFTTFTLESNYIGNWRNKKRFENKSEDFRVVKLAHAEKKSDKILTDEEALEFLNNIDLD